MPLLQAPVHSLPAHNRQPQAGANKDTNIAPPIQ